jgi:hypothetical protein
VTQSNLDQVKSESPESPKTWLGHKLFFLANFFFIPLPPFKYILIFKNDVTQVTQGYFQLSQGIDVKLKVEPNDVTFAPGHFPHNIIGVRFSFDPTRLD